MNPMSIKPAIQLLTDWDLVLAAWVPGTPLMVACVERGQFERTERQGLLLNPWTGQQVVAWAVPSHLHQNPLLSPDARRLVLNCLLWDFGPTHDALLGGRADVPAPGLLSPGKSTWFGEYEPVGGVCAFSEDGERFYHGWQWVLTIEDRAGHKIYYQPPAAAIYCVAVSSRHLAVAVPATPEAQRRGASGSLLLLDGKTAKPLAEFEGVAIRRRTQVGALAFAPDGQRRAMGVGRVVSVWDVDARVQLIRFPAYRKPIHSLAWHPDGALLAAADYSSDARVWDTTTGAELLRLGSGLAHGGFAFTPDGRTLARWGGGLELWDTPVVTKL
jgi:WD40 repeat protein